MSVAADFVGMEPGPYDFTIFPGATLKKVFTWKDSAGAVIDLSGCTGRMKARIPPSEAEVFSLTNGAGVALGGAAGTVTVQPTGLNSGLPTGSYVYDLEIETAAGDVLRFLQGAVTVTTEQTR